MFEGPKEVIYKRIPRAGYFNISSYPKSTTGGIGAEITESGFSTGLTAEEEAYFEDKLGLKPGQLNRHSEWWGHPFNTTYSLTLNNTKPTKVLLDSPLNQLKYKVSLASSKIANNELEKNKPNYQFYIVDEEAKARKENEQFDYEFEAYEIIMKLSPEDKRGALRLFGKTGVDTFSESVVKAELAKQIKKDPKEFVDTLSDKRLKTKMFIEELQDYKLLNRKGNYFMHGEDTIASSTEECIAFFEDLKNQSVKLALETRLKKSKKDK